MVLRASWGPLGPLLDALGGLLGASWAPLGCSGGPLGASWALPGSFWGTVGGDFGASWGLLAALLAASLVHIFSEAVVLLFEALGDEFGLHS